MKLIRCKKPNVMPVLYAHICSLLADDDRRLCGRKRVRLILLFYWLLLHFPPTIFERSNRLDAVASVPPSSAAAAAELLRCSARSEGQRRSCREQSLPYCGGPQGGMAFTFSFSVSFGLNTPRLLQYERLQQREFPRTITVVREGCFSRCRLYSLRLTVSMKVAPLTPSINERRVRCRIIHRFAR